VKKLIVLFVALFAFVAFAEEQKAPAPAAPAPQEQVAPAPQAPAPEVQAPKAKKEKKADRKSVV
jgi:hypothetical protein